MNLIYKFKTKILGNVYIDLLDDDGDLEKVCQKVFWRDGKPSVKVSGYWHELTAEGKFIGRYSNIQRWKLAEVNTPIMRPMKQNEWLAKLMEFKLVPEGHTDGN